jgi:hypothetical protein
MDLCGSVLQLGLRRVDPLEPAEVDYVPLIVQGEYVPLIADPVQAQRLVPELEGGAVWLLSAEHLVHLVYLGLDLLMPARSALHV